MEPEELGNLLKSRKDADPNFKAAIKADTKTPLGMFIKVYDAAHVAGMSHLQMLMNKPAGNTAP